MPNIVLSPTRETKNIILAFEKFTIFLEQQYLITKTIKCCCSSCIVNSGRDDPRPVGRDPGKQPGLQRGIGGYEHWEQPKDEY